VDCSLAIALLIMLLIRLEFNFPHLMKHVTLIILHDPKLWETNVTWISETHVASVINIKRHTEKIKIKAITS
jgi:hypothetical protein